MKSVDYSKVVVKKPWGHEYLCYSNGDVAVWYLFIKKGERTSMHCHPSKNTGLVLLEGEVELSFIRNKVEMKGLDKIHIFRARFHSSYAQTDSYLFEVEAPEDKEDLVRLDDEYGREGKGYEGQESFYEKDKSHFWLKNPAQKPQTDLMHGCSLKHIEILDVEQLAAFNITDYIVFTKGGVVTHLGKKILWPGDIADGQTLGRIAPKFSIEPNTSILHIRKNET